VTTAGSIRLIIPEDRWNAAHAASLDERELLLYRSNLLGADLAITNFGGGNTSAKIDEADPLTDQAVKVLWVKGSGGDLGSMAADGFASLYLDKLLMLERRYRGLANEDEMVAMLPHCTFGLNPRPASIDTPLHGFLPFAHIDHLHPDAVIALAAARDGAAIVKDIYGGRVGWLPWQRPGFDLGLRLRDYVRANLGLDGLVLAGHGLFSWGDTAEDCYRNSVALIAVAARHLNSKIEARPVFGAALDIKPVELTRAASRFLEVRGALNREGGHKVGYFDQSAEVMDFIGSERLDQLAALGTSCPDHFLRTKIRPLVLRDGDDAVAAVAAYRADYAAYYARHAKADSPPLRDANPVIILMPGIGMACFAANRTTARIAGEFYRNAINVMRGAEAAGGYVAIDEAEAFAIEYWALEEAKLRRMPSPRPLAGRTALITGAAGGIGSAIAERLGQEGACLFLTDINAEALAETVAVMTQKFGGDMVGSAVLDVTKETAVASGFAAAASGFGGIDILVANAGIASSAPFVDTSMELWRRNMDVLLDGYFLTTRAAFEQMQKLGGGAMIIIGSKNGLAASPGAVAYSTAKGAELHMARGLALEGAPFGIRVNSVNPDAVIQGSRIWDGAWREERAAAHGIGDGELEEHYRNRSLLKRDVLPADVAEAVCFLASDASAKSTGNIINVDAGNAGAFTR
jgi:rhamnulose-1-phosphate aldolase/alcohol dehydrogenase